MTSTLLLPSVVTSAISDARVGDAPINATLSPNAAR